MSRPIDAHPGLERALIALLGEGQTHVRHSWSRPWASITFSGARHHYVIDLDGNDAAPRGTDFATTSAFEEFGLRGHLVADLTVTANAPQREGARITIEALTVEAA